MIEYRHVRDPFPYQKEDFEASRDKEFWGILWEPGLGKSKITIDTASWLFQNGKIDGWVIVAPNGVHRNWVTDEIPKHLGVPAAMMVWYTAGSKKKSTQEVLSRLIHHKGLSILAMSYDATMTEDGRNALARFLKARRCLFSADETPRIKNPSAKRTRRLLKAAQLAPYRRILTGTPVTNSPFDLYSQLKFLDEKIWEQHGIGGYVEFKTMFGVFERGFVGSGQNRREFPKLAGYRNLELMNKILASVSTRRTKDEELQLPPKLYTRRTFELTKRQRTIYDDLREQFIVFLEQGTVTADLAITRMLRLQQATCGYLPVDNPDHHVLVDIDNENPRLELLKELCEDLPHKAIIWCRFRRDVDLIMDALAGRAVRYDGLCSDEQLAQSIDDFRKDKQFFVGNPALGAEGITLTEARTVIYYSNSFNLSQRLQSEDRAHRIGQEHPVNYIDIVAEDTVDQHIAEMLVRKMDLAAMITGDSVRTWLRGPGEPHKSI